MKTKAMTTIMITLFLASMLSVTFNITPVNAESSSIIYEDALIKTSNYLISIQDPNGWWHYMPPPYSLDIMSLPATANGILQMVEAYKLTEDPIYLERAELAGQRLITFCIKADGTFNDWVIRVWKGSRELNYISTLAPAWISLFKVTGNSTYKDAAIAMGNYFLTEAARVLVPTHKWYGFYYYYPQFIGFDPAYYWVAGGFNYLSYGPEQLYTLASLYEITGDPNYLEAAELAAEGEMKYQYGSWYATETAVRGWLAFRGVTFTDEKWADVWQKLEGYWPDKYSYFGEDVEDFADKYVTVYSQYGPTKILAYAKLYEITGDTNYLDVIENYAEWALDSGVHHPDGYFYKHTGPDTGWEWSTFYGGKDRRTRPTSWSAIALLEAYRLTGNKDYFNAAIKAADWMINDHLTYDPATGKVYRSQNYYDVYIAYSQTPFGLLMAALSPRLHLKDLKDEIIELDDSDFKDPTTAGEKKASLIDKINVVENMINLGKYQQAIIKLKIDIKPKLDTGYPQCWLEVPHTELVAKIDLTIAILGSL